MTIKEWLGNQQGLRLVEGQLVPEQSANLHDTNLVIAAYALKHFDEIKDCNDLLITRLITDSYDSEEIQPIVTLVKKLFIHKYGNLSGWSDSLTTLSSHEQLQLFRYIEAHQENTDFIHPDAFIRIMVDMPKLQRDIYFFFSSDAFSKISQLEKEHCASLFNHKK